MRKRTKAENVLLWAVALVWLVVCLFPLYNLISVTFSTDDSNMIRTFVPNSFSNGVEKLKLALTEGGILSATADSTMITVVTILGMLLICSLAAYEFSFYSFPGKKLLFACVMASMMLPMVLYIVPLYRFVVSINLADTLVGVCLPLMVSAFSVFVLMQFLEDTPASLIESARIDGAGHFTIFGRIVLPLMRNAIITTTVLMFMSVWGSYMWPSLVASTRVRPMSVAIANLLNPLMYVDPRVKIAAMLLSCVMPLAIYFLFQRYIIDGIATSGIKE